MPNDETNLGTPETTSSPQGTEPNNSCSGTSMVDTQDSRATGQSLSSNEPVSPLDNPQNLPSVIVGVDENPDVKEPSLPMIGFYLSKFVLYIISGFILLLIIFLFVKQFDASPEIKIPAQTNISDSTYSQKIEMIKIIQEEKKNYRDFTLQIAQMVLLNLLLPVLTAILGYIFASNKNKE